MQKNIKPLIIIGIAIVIIIALYIFIEASGKSTRINNNNIEYIKDPEVDTDNDGLRDIEEIDFGLDPLRGDTDGDGLSDWYEINVFGTNALATDTDKDGISDGEEARENLQLN